MDYILDRIVRRRCGQREDWSCRKQVSDREEGPVRVPEALSPFAYHVAFVYRHEINPRLEMADDSFETVVLKGLWRCVYVLYVLRLRECHRGQVHLGVGRIVRRVAVCAQFKRSEPCYLVLHQREKRRDNDRDHLLVHRRKLIQQALSG